MDFRYANDTRSKIVVWLEPWAEEIPLEPGSSLILRIFYTHIDTIETGQADDFFVIWFWRGCRVQVFVDGEDRTVGSMSSPAPV